MLEVKEALEKIFKECVPTNETEYVSYKNAMNRTLAEDVIATEPFPPFRAAIKDGYAAISTDNTTVRKVVTYIAAGDQVMNISILVKKSFNKCLS